MIRLLNKKYQSIKQGFLSPLLPVKVPKRLEKTVFNEYLQLFSRQNDVLFRLCQFLTISYSFLALLSGFLTLVSIIEKTGITAILLFGCITIILLFFTLRSIVTLKRHFGDNRTIFENTCRSMDEQIGKIEILLQKESFWQQDPGVKTSLTKKKTSQWSHVQCHQCGSYTEMLLEECSECGQKMPSIVVN